MRSASPPKPIIEATVLLRFGAGHEFQGSFTYKEKVWERAEVRFDERGRVSFAPRSPPPGDYLVTVMVRSEATIDNHAVQAQPLGEWLARGLSSRLT